MRKNKLTRVVILIFIDEKRIFVEKRQLKGFSEDQYLIPGGIDDPS